MSFWDGTRWVDDVATQPTNAPTPKQPRRSRAKDWLATGLMAVAAVALVAPSGGASAASLPSGSALVASWDQGGTVKAYAETNSRIDYNGHWIRADHEGHMGGHVRFSNQRDAGASLRFTGSAISWIGPVGSTRGKANVYIDGKLAKTVSTYASAFKPGRVLFKQEWAAVGSHRITIEVLGTRGSPHGGIGCLRRANVQVPSSSADRIKPAPTAEPVSGGANVPQGDPEGPSLGGHRARRDEDGPVAVRIRRRFDRHDRLRRLDRGDADLHHRFGWHRQGHRDRAAGRERRSARDRHAGPTATA